MSSPPCILNNFLFNHLFIYIKFMNIYLVLPVIIRYYFNIFVTQIFFCFDHWDHFYLDISCLPLMYPYVHALTCMYVEHLLSDTTKCISLITYIFPKSSNQIFLPRTDYFFLYQRMALETKIWILCVLIIIGVSLLALR